VTIVSVNNISRLLVVADTFLMKLRHNVGSAKGTIAGSRVGARTMLQPLLRKSFLGFDID
jgi:hypothetical protein